MSVGAPRGPAARARTWARIRALRAYSPYEARFHEAPACFPFDWEPHALALWMVWFQFEAPQYVRTLTVSFPDESERNAPALVCSRERPACFHDRSACFHEAPAWSPRGELPCSESLTPRGWKCDSRLGHSVHRPLSLPLDHAR